MNRNSTLSALIVLLILVTGCGGGGGGRDGKLIVGSIQGPTIVNEGGTAVQYSISASGDTGITYLWSVSPSGAGTFKVQGVATTAFIASPVSADTTAKIRCVVGADHSDPVTSELNIEIKEVTGLTVGGIQGPTTVTENSLIDYIVTADGDSGIEYEWECEPESAGTFNQPQSPHTVFQTTSVTTDTPATIRVTVQSDNYGPQERSINITITDTDALLVGDIEGPDSVPELSFNDYSVFAEGDTGITYEWECDDPSVGTFTDPSAETGEFETSVVTADITVSIQVTVNSDSYGPEVRTKDVLVEDVNALVVLEINGPDTVVEETSVEYTISAGGDTGIEYQWEVDPETAGTFTYGTESDAMFNAGEVDDDTPATISVTVTSDNYAPEVRTLDITITNVVLTVGQIQGPTLVPEDSSTQYSVPATGDTGITYLWECFPVSAGSFTDIHVSPTEFESVVVGGDTPVTLQVTVDSDNFDPEVRTRDIEIVDTDVLWVGAIEGPPSVGEDGSVNYSVSALGDTGITYLWEVDPDTAGAFTEPAAATSEFIATEVSDDLPATISVTVACDHYDAEIRTKDIQINNLVLEVGDILGPTLIDEGDSVGYSITATGDAGITYLWECVPPNAGLFTNGDTANATFDAGPIYADTPTTIQVTVDSDHSDPVVKTLDIDINDTFVLTATEIDGPTTVDENTPVTYSASAEGDTGIVYQWTSIPPSAGTFTDPGEPSTQFNPAVTGADVPATIRMTVSADHYAPEIRNLDIRIRDLANHGFAATWGGTGSDAGFSTATDQLGNMYVAGAFAETVDFDPGQGIDERTSNGSFDAFLGKFDPAGNLLWARTWGGSDSDQVYGLFSDSAGNTYVTGWYQNAVDFDPGPGTFQYVAVGNKDVYLSKFDSSGTFLWVNVWGGSYGDEGISVGLGQSGDVYVAGFFRSTVDFDPTPDVEYHDSNGDRDVFLCKFDTSGGFLWVRTWGGSGDDYGYALALDTVSNVYVTGDFEGSVDFDPGPGVYQRTSTGGGTDVFISKLDSTGALQWAWNWDAWGRDIVVNSSGNIYVTGPFSGTVDFDPSPGVDEHISNGDDDSYYSKFTPAGDFVRAITWGGSSDDAGRSIAVDSLGYVYVAGYFRYSADFDPGAGTDQRDAVGDFDACVSKFDSGGNYIWAQTWGGTDSDMVYGVSAFSSSYLCLTGYFEETVDFDPGSWIDVHSSEGSDDVFLMKLLTSGTW